MKPAVIRLVICAALFVMWLGYLGYLVLTRPVTTQGQPLVLSRPQILSSEIDVIARVSNEPKGVTEVEIVEVLSPEDSPLKSKTKIKVANLDECRAPPRSREEVPRSDWSGDGDYLLPLRAVAGQPGLYEVAPVPASPGFEMHNLVRIYPDTAEARQQYRQIKQ
jgi:hypothetical protein